MKKCFNKILSVVLALVMVLCSASIAFAKEAKTPVIMVHGLGAIALYENAGTANQKEIENLGLGSVGDIVGGIFGEVDMLYQIVRMMDPNVAVSNEKLIKYLANMVSKSKLNCDANGDVLAGQGVDGFWTDSLANHRSYWEDAQMNENGIAHQLCDTIGAENVYLFRYDWRQDVCKTASDLNAYIQNVKAQTGASKVTVVGCSLGGSVLAAYLDAYKNNNDVNRCIFVNAAFQGVDVARSFAKDLAIDSATINKYLKNLRKVLFGGSKSALIGLGIGVADVRIGYVADYLATFLQDEKNVDALYTQVLKGWIGNIPALWECIPYDSFDKAVNEMSKIGFLDKNSGLYTKITNYHAVQGRLKSNLKAIKKNGVEIAIFADYGTMGIPVTSKAMNQTDILIDTKYASAGATTANIGKKLKAKGKYVSADKAINAKTCILPDNTWFLKNMQHMAFSHGSQACKLLANVTCGKVKCNIKAVKKKYKYNQFLKADADQNLSNKL